MPPAERFDILFLGSGQGKQPTAEENSCKRFKPTTLLHIAI